MFTSGAVTVITAATGHAILGKCLDSVQRQSFPAVEHLLVIDGPQHEAAVRQAMAGADTSKPLKMLVLPHATGRQRWTGHRIYGAMSFLCNTEFLCYLDEDNWFGADHVQSLMDAAAAEQTLWAFSLRKIRDAQGNWIADDCCESLGNLHSVFNDPHDVLIDTNCYLLRREVAVMYSPLWYRPARPAVMQEADRAFCQALLKHVPRVACSRRHSVNYTVGNRPDSVKAEFFLHGNAIMRQRYPGGMPWEI